MKKIVLLCAPILAILLVFATCKDDEQMIELSGNIKNYINAHYQGYEIEESEQDTLCNGANVYEVELEGSNDQEIELIFDAEGNLLYTKKEISNNQLSPALNESFANKYPGYSIKESVRLDGANGLVRFELEIKKGASRLEVLFDADGAFVCEETGDDDSE